ncbi:hypothetical protein FD723_39905 (plasmid) [Nostoc sp. C052]|uniref:hypothetical protein n=1 Tax=Nostoc sp. C052 TaxID=2576902 RepID=UPI0015C38481|nr:hypothetical protein [Nostoc sp. C052]QLE46378.1 hypothetical protein FD723_39905 [Nostoc sp. C052]
MSIPYGWHYELQEVLSKEPSILKSPQLYSFDDGKVYAAIMDRLAQPLAEGVGSPFSSRNPLSGHGQLAGMLVHLLGVNAHQMNLIPNRVWLENFRMLGISLAAEEYPIIELVFRRSYDAYTSNIGVTIPLGTEVGNDRLEDVYAITTATVEINGEDLSVSVPARLNIQGKLDIDINPGDFTVLPRMLSFVESVSNTTVLYAGRDQEKLSEAMLRARQQMQIGLRCVTARDYYVTALNLGAEKVNIIPGVYYPSGDYYTDLITIAVYPPEIAPFIKSTLLERTMVGTRLDVIAAEIVPIDGIIDVRIIPALSNLQAFEIAATAIQSLVNPPFGNWGDRNFAATVATALENQPESIYAVPSLKLKHANTDQNLSEITIQPWQLCEIQESVEFVWHR